MEFEKLSTFLAEPTVTLAELSQTHTRTAHLLNWHTAVSVAQRDCQVKSHNHFVEAVST